MQYLQRIDMVVTLALKPLPSALRDHQVSVQLTKHQLKQARLCLLDTVAAYVLAWVDAWRAEL
jgi:hypothetical protein